MILYELPWFTAVAKVVGKEEAIQQLTSAIGTTDWNPLEAEALWCLFYWRDSPQGYAYWYNIQELIDPQWDD